MMARSPSSIRVRVLVGVLVVLGVVVLLGQSTAGGAAGAGSAASESRAASKSTAGWPHGSRSQDRKSTRLNSSHLGISYAVFCLKKKKKLNKTKTNYAETYNSYTRPSY